MVDLAQRDGLAGPAPGANHFSADLGLFRLKWKRHTELSRYKVIVPDADDDPFAAPVPADWLAGLLGQVLAATHVGLVPAGDGLSRLLVLDRRLTRRHAANMIQRLLEIDTSRVMARFLSQCERELAMITTALTEAGGQNEPALLGRLTRLPATIESRHANNHYRFGARRRF